MCVHVYLWAKSNTCLPLFNNVYLDKRTDITSPEVFFQYIDRQVLLYMKNIHSIIQAYLMKWTLIFQVYLSTLEHTHFKDRDTDTHSF